MVVELKDLIAWGLILVGTAGAFFHLRGRVSILEALLVREKEAMDQAISDIKTGLKDTFKDFKESLRRIEEKLDDKADK